MGATDRQPRISRWAPAAYRRAMLMVALGAAFAVLGVYIFDAWPGLEAKSVGVRFALRGAKAPSDVVVIGVDDKTLNDLQVRWPFPRSLDARAVDALRKDHVRTIVYDVQFTQPTAAREDLALYDAISRAPGVVLATTEIGQGATTNVLGGDANLARAHARAAAAGLHANSSGVIQKYPYKVGGLKTLAVAAAEEASGHTISAKDYNDGAAWIDFRGAVRTIPLWSFSDLLHHRISPSQLAGKIVVIGA